MATALDLLMSTKEDVNLLSEESDICTIDAKTRAIFVPSTIVVGGVQSDKNAERIKFSCPKIVGDNLDLSKFSVRINFENVSSVDFNVSIKDQYICDDVAVDGENVTFSWLIGRNAARYMGTVRFIVCAVKTDSDSNISVEWNTAIAEVPVLEGIEIDQPQIGQEEKDVINQLLELTKNTSAEAVQNVNSAKEQAIKDIQSVSQPDTTLTIEGGLAEAKATGEAIGSLKEDLGELEDGYFGYNGHLKKYEHGVGFYTANNEYNPSTSYVWFDLKLDGDIIISNTESNGVVNILNDSKEFIESYVNWQPIARTYKKELGPYIRLSVSASELNNIQIYSPNSRINKTISIVDSSIIPKIINCGNWEYGILNDDTGEDADNRKAYIRTSEFIAIDYCEKISVSVVSGFTSEFYFWNGDVYIGHKIYKNNTDDIFVNYPNATKIKVVLCENDYSNIKNIDDVASKLTVTAVIITLKTVGNNIERIEKIEDVLKINYAPPRMITLIDDDGGNMFYEAILPLVKEMHIPIVSANCGINTSDDMAWKKGRMNWTKLNECMENGVEVVSHSYKDIGGTTYPIIDENGNQVMSDVDIMHDLTQCRNLLRMHGCNVEAIVSPNHSDEYAGFVKCCEHVGHSYAFTNVSEHSGRIYKKGEADRWYIDRYYLDNKLMDVNTLKDVIDEFPENSVTGWMVMNFHCTFANWADDKKVPIMVNNLKTMIQYAIDKGIIFVSAEVGARAYL